MTIAPCTRHFYVREFLNRVLFFFTEVIFPLRFGCYQSPSKHWSTLVLLAPLWTEMLGRQRIFRVASIASLGPLTVPFNGLQLSAPCSSWTYGRLGMHCCHHLNRSRSVLCLNILTPCTPFHRKGKTPPCWAARGLYKGWRRSLCSAFLGGVKPIYAALKGLIAPREPFLNAFFFTTLSLATYWTTIVSRIVPSVDPSHTLLLAAISAAKLENFLLPLEAFFSLTECVQKV